MRKDEESLELYGTRRLRITLENSLGNVFKKSMTSVPGSSSSIFISMTVRFEQVARGNMILLDNRSNRLLSKQLRNVKVNQLRNRTIGYIEVDR